MKCCIVSSHIETEYVIIAIVFRSVRIKLMLLLKLAPFRKLPPFILISMSTAPLWVLSNNMLFIRVTDI